MDRIFKTTIDLTDSKHLMLVEQVELAIMMHIDPVCEDHSLQAICLPGWDRGKKHEVWIDHRSTDPLHKLIWQQAREAFRLGEFDSLINDELPHVDVNAEHRTYVGSAA